MIVFVERAPRRCPGSLGVGHMRKFRTVLSLVAIVASFLAGAAGASAWASAQSLVVQGTGDSGSAAGDVLVDGSPPLTRALVDKAAATFEWVLAAHLTAAQKSSLQDNLV